MIDLIPVREERTLEDFALYPELRAAVRELEGSGAQAACRLEGCTVWMVNSTAHGGGVAEMMPMIVSLLRQLGVNTKWVASSPARHASSTLPSACTTCCTEPESRT